MKDDPAALLPAILALMDLTCSTKAIRKAIEEGTKATTNIKKEFFSKRKAEDERWAAVRKPLQDEKKTGGPGFNLEKWKAKVCSSVIFLTCVSDLTPTPTVSLRRQKLSTTRQSLPISMPTTRQTTSPNRVILPTPIQMAGPTIFSPPHHVSVLLHATNARTSPSGLGSLPYGASVPPMLNALTRKAKEKTLSSRVGGRRQKSRKRRMKSSKPKWHKR